MSRRTLAVFVVGWLLGVITAVMTPTLIYERRSISLLMEPSSGEMRVDSAVSNGWIVTHKDGEVYTLERPRFRIP